MDQFLICCHSENESLLREQFGKLTLTDTRTGRPVVLSAPLGVEIHVNDAVPRWAKRWEFPPTPFVEYEKSDEAWAVPLGFGRWVDDVGNPAIYAIPTRDRLRTYFRTP